MIRRSPNINQRRERGAALVIVLAFVVLLTALVVAYLTRSSTERQMATGNFSQTNADILARSALDIIVGDFKQEIASGSGGSPPSYTLSSNANIVPMRSGNPTTIPNLIRRSVRSDSVTSPAVVSHASAINSTTDPSLNGRFVSSARWNSHFLIPKLNLSDDQPDPIAGFIPPDWVLLSRAGPTVQTAMGSGSSALNDKTDTNANFVIGRYAYAVYDEGGLLDMNVAAYPLPTPGATPVSSRTDVGRKGTVAFADLTALPTTAAGNVTLTVINRLVGWRNYATIQPAGAFPALTISTANASSFVLYALDRVRDFRSVGTTVTAGGRTDQAFITRAELIKLRSSSGAGAASMLQHLGTFSRAANTQTWQDASTRLSARFPLQRFDLFTNPTGNAANIKRYFGVEYVPRSPSPPVIQEHWRYSGANGAPGSMQSSIHVLTGNGQDPDLSVLLRYGFPSSVADGEILSIMASLIDQQDSDAHTTWIEYGDPLTPSKAWGADSTPPTSPTDPRPSPPPVMLKRSFRNVGELGYAYRNGSSLLDFQSSASTDAFLLDLFTYNNASLRAGGVSLNTRDPSVIAAILKSAITSESSSALVTNTSNTTGAAITAANRIVAETTARPVIGRQDVTRLASSAVVNSTPFTSNQEARETIVRALAEIGQTRTWGLFIDVIAQSGRYPVSASNLSDFVVEGEKRYWLHIAIDRFTGQVIDQQLEAVYE